MPSRRNFTLLLASLFAGGRAFAVGDERLGWVAAEVPPFLSLGPRGAQGYAFELYARVCRQAELPVELHFYPWARAMRMLLGGQAYAGLAVARSPERETRFHWLFPVGNFRFAIFTRVEGGLLPHDVEALRTQRVGSLRASASRELLGSMNITNVVEGKDYRELVALLQRGVVDAIIGPEPVLRALPVDPQTSPVTLRSVALDRSLTLYAVAGPAMPDDVRRRLTAAYQHLVDNGFVAQLKKRHPEAGAREMSLELSPQGRSEPGGKTRKDS